MRFFARLSLAFALILSGLLPVEAQSLSRPISTERSRSQSEWLIVSALPLDNLSAAAAYDSRKLRTAYQGPIWRVRRSSDNAEADIGAGVNGLLDQVALLAHVGGGSGFMVTWYDQSGNNRHATQSTGANQPRVVNAGVVDTLNGVPAPVFSGGQPLVCGGTRFGDQANFSAISTFRRSDAAAAARSVFGNRTTAGRILRTTNSTILYANINAGAPAAIAYTNASAVVHSVIMQSGGAVRHRVNGAGEQSTGAAYIAANATMQIGTQATGGEFFTGSIGGVIFFDGVISDADRLNLERSQGTIFGISIP